MLKIRFFNVADRIVIRFHERYGVELEMELVTPGSEVRLALPVHPTNKCSSPLLNTVYSTQTSENGKHSFLSEVLFFIENTLKNKHNLFKFYHTLAQFSRRQIGDILLIFSRKQDLTFHANCLHWRQFA